MSKTLDHISAIALEATGVTEALAWTLLDWLGIVWSGDVACLRFDDTGALPLSTLEKRPRGMFAVFCRTKTSGLDKQISLLPISVSDEAYVGQPWFDLDQALKTEHFGLPRDYLSCLSI